MSAIAAAKMTPFMTIRGLMLEFYGHQLFRERLILSTVSGKAVKISNIRSQDANPGLTGIFCILLDFMSNFRLRLRGSVSSLLGNLDQRIKHRNQLYW